MGKPVFEIFSDLALWAVSVAVSVYLYIYLFILIKICPLPMRIFLSTEVKVLSSKRRLFLNMRVDSSLHIFI